MGQERGLLLSRRYSSPRQEFPRGRWVWTCRSLLQTRCASAPASLALAGTSPAVWGGVHPPNTGLGMSRIGAGLAEGAGSSGCRGLSRWGWFCTGAAQVQPSTPRVVCV